MGIVENYLAASENLFAHLNTIPSEDERDLFIEQIDLLLKEREDSMKALSNLKELDLKTNPFTDRLIELDKGIINRLDKVMSVIKGDISGLQQMKRRESSYTNPYAATQTTDGIYFDNKK